MYTLIENFCLGLRRLELFGRARSLRRGWVSALAEGEEGGVGAVLGGDVSMESEETPVRWEREAWEMKMKEFAIHAGGRCVVPMTPGMFLSSYVFKIYPHDVDLAPQKSTHFDPNPLYVVVPVTNLTTHLPLAWAMRQAEWLYRWGHLVITTTTSILLRG